MPATVLREESKLRILHQKVGQDAIEEAKHCVPTVRWQLHLQPGEPTPVPMFFAAGSSAAVSAGEWLIFELLQPPEHPPEQVAQFLANAKWTTHVGSNLLFENDLCRLWDFSMPPRGGSRLDFHQHVLSYAFVFLGAGKLDVFKPVVVEGEPLRAEPCGQLARQHLGVVWNERANLVQFGLAGQGDEDAEVQKLPIIDKCCRGGQEDGVSPTVPGALHSVENALETEFREYMIELK